MKTIQLQDELEARLKEVSQSTGCAEEALVAEALREHLDELEDLYTAIVRSTHPGRVYSADEVKRELGL